MSAPHVAVDGPQKAATRVLIVVRLSHLTDTTTSPERQLAVCRDYVAARPGWSVVGIAEDLDVSAAAVPPFERPSLRTWLSRPADYDAILFWRGDRLFRSVFDLADMIRWANEHDVGLVSATEAHFDTTSEFGQLITMLVIFIAQMETTATKERTQQAYDFRIKEGKYRGGHPPMGYRPIKHPELGWRLELDSETAPLTRSIVDRVINGDRLTTICNELNQAGIPTAQDHFRIVSGNEPKGSLWRTGNLGKALKSPTLMGHIVTTDRNTGTVDVLRDEAGAPIVRATPLIDRLTFERLQEALTAANGKRTPYKKSEALLLQVLFCGGPCTHSREGRECPDGCPGTCDRPMYRAKGRTHLYYRCPSASLGLTCGNKSVRMDKADEAVETAVLELLGHLERMERIYDPGNDTVQEIADKEAELADIAGLIGTAAFRAGPARERLEGRAVAIAARLDMLQAEPQRPAGYSLVGTGVSVRDHWKGLDPAGRNLYLRELGVRAVAGLDESLIHFTGSTVRLMGKAVGMPEHMIEKLELQWQALEF